MDYQVAIAALADPTRRSIVDRLRAGAMPVGRLAAGLPVSRPAVSQHLKILAEAGLLDFRAEGNRRLYALRPDGLAPLRDYLDSLWDDALASFVAAAHLKAQEATP